MSSSPAALARPPLRRPRECVVSGTAAAVAAHLGWTVAGVRVVFVLLSLVSGAGILLYAWLWAFTPWADAVDAGAVPGAQPSRRAPVAWILLSSSVVGVFAAMVVTAVSLSNGAYYAATSSWWSVIVLTTVLASAAGLWATFIDRPDPARGPRHALAVRIAATVVLGILLVVQVSSLQRGGVVSFVGALVLIGGIALIHSSTFIDRWRELSGERVRRIREEQRSAMAAHLHDSVLQTLALIQNRSGASSEVARLARAQERELRAWLYDGDAPADSDLPTDLRDYAAALELDYPVHIDVVATGASGERASGEVAAAAREAMLNAARHAGGEVSVYIEGTADAVDVFVRDRGPGFDLDVVPDDRLGVRESIVGRMRRIGGAATVRPGAGGTGVEVHLSYGGAS
ncbi:ATP-binding protein [Microbacterium rhizomatis]|uniref:PspC domain-containing protein n=1 Tax=Microbacterium rhizomatis TaxID=1631477 RepID=A0A5J5J5P5_9MICO|nr:ATP-binding protein [Microbacterium rhizomatis]KAA9111380.1 PspC domain-containing protein [Microbacterium rhizomatis]